MLNDGHGVDIVRVSDDLDLHVPNLAGCGTGDGNRIAGGLAHALGRQLADHGDVDHQDGNQRQNEDQVERAELFLKVVFHGVSSRMIVGKEKALL